MYYYNDGKTEVGPFDSDHLNKLSEAGLISSGTLIRSATTDDWTTYGQLQLEPILGCAPAPHPGQTSTPEETRQEYSGSARQGDESGSTGRTAQLTGNSTELPEASHVAAPDGWLSQPPTPWRRYAARILDTSVNGTIVFFIIGMVFYSIAPISANKFFSIFETDGGGLLDILLTAFVASFLGGMLIGVSGSTLGKWIFGVRITRIDGSKLGLGAGLSRDFHVYLRGLGMGIPIVSLGTLISSFSKLKNETTTPWDKGKYIVWHRPNGLPQYILNVVGVLLIAIVLSALRSL